MFGNSFSAFLINLAIAAFWLAIALSTHQYFVALGSIFFIAIAFLMDLPESSSEEGSASIEDVLLGGGTSSEPPATPDDLSHQAQ